MDRNQSVSIAKGIAIVLMVAAHANCPSFAQKFIGMFHMPLFFFMSGYCFRNKYLQDVKGYLIKRIYGLWLPFVKYELVFLLLHNLFFELNIYDYEFSFNGVTLHDYSSFEIVKRAIFIVFTMSHGERLLGGLWFLRSLFLGSIIFYFAIRGSNFVVESRNSKGVFVGIFLLLITMLFEVIFPASSNICANILLAGFFICIGYLYKSLDLEIDRKIILIVFSGILVAIGAMYWPCGMMSLEFYNTFPYAITAIIGTLMVLGISRHISKCNNWCKKILVYIGDNTLDILIWHFLCFKLVNLLIIGLYELPMNKLADFPVIEYHAVHGWWLIYLIVGVCLPLLIGMLKDNVKSYLKDLLKFRFHKS